MGRDLRVPCGRTKDGHLLCLDELDPNTSYTGEHALYCPSCGSQLVVRHYRKDKTLRGQVYCLAHKASDVNSCHGVGGETLIHLLMKRVFLDLIGREFPLPFPHDLHLRLDHPQWAFPWVLTDALVEQPFLVWDERRGRDVRKQPDVSAQFVCGAFPVSVSVEICVTHDKSEDDLILLKQLGRPVLEIYPDLVVDDSRLSDPAYVAHLRFSCEYYLTSDDDPFRMSWRGTFPKELALSLAWRSGTTCPLRFAIITSVRCGSGVTRALMRVRSWSTGAIHLSTVWSSGLGCVSVDVPSTSSTCARLSMS